MKREEIAGLVGACALPEGLKAYLAAALKRRRPFSFTAALKKDPAIFLASAGRLLAGASAALGRPEAQALFATGFDPANLAPQRLEAAFAELLAAMLLRGEGFSSIELIGTNSGRTADVSAARDGLRWAFEVRCLSAPGRLDAGLLTGKFRSKLPQAANALKKYGFDRAAVVLVRSPWDSDGFVPDPALAALAADARARGKKKPAAHLCVLDRGRFGVAPRW